jgi:serine/threonine protein kinase/formylglycine-generating enzyme required for sulfatase activity
MSGASDDPFPTRFHREPREQPGEAIGPFRLIAPIGEGGFGTVWLAERIEPFTQRVAIKFLRAGLDSEAVVARFEQERQSLALMNHPDIAKVLDGGLTAAGRPYFVMEHVEGEPITRFCDARGMGLAERLALFARVCDAVQHAHVKGVVHRDLKPSNILAFATDDGCAPKVIDFGVAKALAEDEAGRPGITELGQLIGTPEYMSPEQADPSSEGIDTRSDVYSLGAVLYELIAGAPPFGECGRETRSRARLLQALRESEAPRPGAAVRARGEVEARRIAEVRGLEPSRLLAMLDGELAWIPLKALRKEPAQRYQSAMELGADVRNYLEGKPLLAGPESTVYRLRKYARRNPLRSLAMVGLPLVVAVLLGVAAVPAYRAYGSYRRALAMQRYTVLAVEPDPSIVTDAAARERIKATGKPWKIRHDETGIVMLLCPPGEYMAGMPETEPGWTDASLEHHCTIRRPFYLAEREVSQAEWLRLMPSNPAHYYIDERLPVEMVSWYHCQEFCAASAGFFRLPSEQEWEYACRAGTTTAYSFGDRISTELVNQAGYQPPDNDPADRYRRSTVACGSLPANQWGFHEMHGNVLEWCEDSGRGPANNTEEPKQTDDPRAYRSIRGGAYDLFAPVCRSGERHSRMPQFVVNNSGLRVARSVD